jgi:hypothetical protein
MIQPLIDYVNHYRSLGWVPLPLHDMHSGHCSCEKTSQCASAGKHPRVSQEKAKTANHQTWHNWIEQWPNMNLAVLTGSEYGFFVVDIDPRHGGDINFDAFCEEHGLPPATLEAKSGGGGRHLFFSARAGQKIKSAANVLGQGIDIRGDGGIIVVEPSATKGAYKWL